jgi:hypothetical protein
VMPPQPMMRKRCLDSISAGEAGRADATGVLALNR